MASTYMKVFRKIGCLLLIAAFSFPCFAKKRINLEGRWSDRFRTILPDQLPIQAWVGDSNKDLILEFSTNLGTVEVTVTNSAGKVVYKQFIEAKSSIIISLEEEMTAKSFILITDGINIISGSV